MRHPNNSQWTPPIVVSDVDRDRLSSLANAAMDSFPDVADDLLGEMDRAKVVPSDSFPLGIVKMGSTVEYESAGQRRRVTMVFPGDADIALGNISILTPVGAALIGLSEGQSIMWMTRDGRSQQLTVVRVESPS
jgi:regulator of nucleoside diphosphate kinase